MMPHIPGQEELEGFDWKGAKKDTVAAKARPGDLVFPVELAQDNPLLIAAMKMVIAQSGADPEAYVAGSQAGNYNPLNDQQHFFLKKIGKSLKKGWDKIRKSPIGSAVMNIAAPVAGFAIGGPAGAALASGAAAKATGASTRNALIAGGLSGVTMGAAAKFGGVSAGSGNFGSRFANTAKGMTAWGKTGMGQVGNLGGSLISGALSRPGMTAGAIGLGAAALAARNNRTPGEAYQADHNRAMQGYQKFMGNQGMPQNDVFAEQMRLPPALHVPNPGGSYLPGGQQPQGQMVNDMMLRSGGPLLLSDESKQRSLSRMRQLAGRFEFGQPQGQTVNDMMLPSDEPKQRSLSRMRQLAGRFEFGRRTA